MEPLIIRRAYSALLCIQWCGLLLALILPCHSFSDVALSRIPFSKLLSPSLRDARLFSVRSDETTNPYNEFQKRDQSRRVVVVGKIIIDQYGDPAKRSKDGLLNNLTVGGGGPQAAWGAAAALACRDYFFRGDTLQHHIDSPLPPKQQVTFIGPVGLKNWTPQHSRALDNILLPVLDLPPVLIGSNDHITPTINIWHDEAEIQKWHPVDGSFDAIGADGLWRDRPDSGGILRAVKNEKEDIVLHCILESGSNPAGKGEDSLFLEDVQLLSKIATLGIEPIVFPDERTLQVSDEDGTSVKKLVVKANESLMQRDDTHDKLFIVIPDKACFDSAFVEEDSNTASTEIIVRDGANGSFTREHRFPSATLQTPNKKPINPTGAGNAYSAAYVACRGTGSTPKEAALLATAVGAVVCEYEHLPEWSWTVLERVAEAAREVETKLSTAKTNVYL